MLLKNLSFDSFVLRQTTSNQLSPNSHTPSPSHLHTLLHHPSSLSFQFPCSNGPLFPRFSSSQQRQRGYQKIPTFKYYYFLRLPFKNTSRVSCHKPAWRTNINLSLIIFLDPSTFLAHQATIGSIYALRSIAYSSIPDLYSPVSLPHRQITCDFCTKSSVPAAHYLPHGPTCITSLWYPFLLLAKLAYHPRSRQSLRRSACIPPRKDHHR